VAASSDVQLLIEPASSHTERTCLFV